MTNPAGQECQALGMVRTFEQKTHREYLELLEKFLASDTKVLGVNRNDKATAELFQRIVAIAVGYFRIEEVDIVREVLCGMATVNSVNRWKNGRSSAPPYLRALVVRWIKNKLESDPTSWSSIPSH